MTFSIPRLVEAIKKKGSKKAKDLWEESRSESTATLDEVVDTLALASGTDAQIIIDFILTHTAPNPVLQKKLFELAQDRAHMEFSFALLLMEHGTPDQLSTLIPLFKHILSRETDARVLEKLLQKIGDTGMEELVHELAEFIFYGDATLKQRSITALEGMKSHKALALLEQIATTHKSDDQVLAAIKNLKKDPLIRLRGGRNMGWEEACQLRARLEKLPPRILEHQDMEESKRYILMETINDLTVPQLIDQISPASPRIKYAVYARLLTLPPTTWDPVLRVSDLFHNSIIIRTCAVHALEAHPCPDTLDKIKQGLDQKRPGAEALTQTLLDCGARKTIPPLMELDSFNFMVSNCLENAPAPVVKAHMRILEQRQMRATQKKYRHLLDARAQKPAILIVSHNPIFRSILSRHIHNQGFSPREMETGQQAFEFALETPCAGMVCDLFMEDMGAPDLIGEIRDIYSPKDLPILISSFHPLASSPVFHGEMESMGAHVADTPLAKDLPFKAGGN